MKKFMLYFSVISFISFGQVPYMVKDIYPGSTNGADFNYRPYSYNNGVLFNAADPTNGKELWWSDGTNANTFMVKDINPGPLSSLTAYYVPYAGKVFLGNGNATWISDATTVGTYTISSLGMSSMNVTMGGILYFIGTSTTAGAELARTDGTSGGTYMLKDVRTGSLTSSISQMMDGGAGKFFFVANDGVAGQELWVSDGTPGGTMLVKDIYPGTGSSTPTLLKSNAGILYFMADDNVNGKELWRSDGTTAGTYLLKDLTPGSGGSGTLGTNNIIYNNKLFFWPGFGAQKLWESDGTVAGTISTANLWSGPNLGFLSNPYIFNNDLYFLSGNVGFTSNFDTLIFYKVTNSISNLNLYKKIKLTSSLNTAEYFTIKQINNNKFLFISNSIYTTWPHILGVSDGTSGGSSVLSYKVPSVAMYANNPTIPYFGGAWYYPLITTSNGEQVHRIDATTGTITLTQNIGNSLSMSNSMWKFNHAVLNNQVFFVGNESNFGKELYVTDGTTAGSFLTLDIEVGSVGSLSGGVSDDGYFLPTTAANNLFFVACNSTNGCELWSLINGTTGVNISELIKGSIHAYPNPFNNELKINYTLASGNNEAVIKLIEPATGRLLMQQEVKDNKGITKFNTENLSAGIYLISVEQKNEAPLVIKVVNTK